MRAEVTVYDQYLCGDIWSVLIEDPAGDILDSCTGFYGCDNAVAEGRSMLADCVAANGCGETPTTV